MSGLTSTMGGVDQYIKRLLYELLDLSPSTRVLPLLFARMLKPQ